MRGRRCRGLLEGKSSRLKVWESLREGRARTADAVLPPQMKTQDPFGAGRSEVTDQGTGGALGLDMTSPV
jgi:hypothetical protein